jgi:hypothetical protein
MVYGSIYDSETGDIAAQFNRTLRPERNDVYHGALTVKGPHKGKGIAREFQRHANEGYRMLGIPQARVGTANEGSVVWAKLGWRLDSDRMSSNADYLDLMLDPANIAMAAAEFNLTPPTGEEVARARELFDQGLIYEPIDLITQMGETGERILRATNWPGVMDI